jgi:hypothetical protein
MLSPGLLWVEIVAPKEGEVKGDEQRRNSMAECKMRFSTHRTS